MSQFEANPNQMKKFSRDIENVSGKIRHIAQQVQDSAGNLKNQSSALAQVAASFTNLAEGLRSRAMLAGECASALQSAANLYQQTENRIMGMRNVSDVIKDRIADGKKHIQDLLEAWGAIAGGKTSKNGAYDGDPVDMTSGNYVDDVVELVIHGPAGLKAIRHYNSKFMSVGDMGIGWSHNYETHLDIFPDHLVLVWSDQTREKYTLKEAGMYQNKASELGTIVLDNDTYRYDDGKHFRMEFDYEGRLIRIVHGNENTALELTYEGDNLANVKDTYGNELTYQYSEDGLLICIYDHSGRKVTFDYDSMCLTAVTAADGLRTEYQYDEGGRLIRVIGPGELPRLLNHYDDENRVVKQELPDGTSAEFTYLGNKVVFKDRNGAETVYIHDEKGRISETVYPDGKETFSYNEQNLRTGYVDLNGNRYTRSFDSKGNIIAYTDALGHTKNYEYDEWGNRIRTELLDGGIVQAEYDDYGNMISLTDSLGINTGFIYEQGLLKEVRYADGSSIQYSYDEKGHLALSIDENGSETHFQYDEVGRCNCRIDGVGARTLYEYDAADRIVKITDALGQERSYTYENGLLKSIKDFDGLEENWAYNAMGLEETYTDKSGRKTEYAYDEMSNISKISYPDGTVVTKTYDEMNRLKKFCGAEGTYCEYQYDPNGNCIRREENGHIQQYEYDAQNRVTGITEGKDSLRRFTYDKAGRISHMIREDGAEFDYQYDTDGRLIRQEMPQSSVSSFEYDLRGRIVRRIDNDQEAVRYEYYPNGLLRRVQWQDGNYTENRYDNANQLIMEQRAGGYTTQYDYDLLGRKVAACDNENRKRQWKYDAVGNVITDINPRGGQIHYAYTPSGKLEYMQDALGNQTYYRYDDMDRLVGLLRGNMDKEQALKILQNPGDFQNPENMSVRLTSWERDGEGRITARVDAMGNRQCWGYRADGQLLFKEDAQHRITSYEYDENDLLRKVVFPDSREALYEHNVFGWITKVSDWTGNLKLTYDAYGRLSSSTDAYDQTFRYGRDVFGRTDCLVYPNGMEFNTHYNEEGLTGELVTEGFRSVYTYDESARVASREICLEGDLTKPERRLQESYRYVPSGKLGQMQQREEDQEILSVEYMYDDAGNMIRRKQTSGAGAAGNEDLKYEYDALNRLQKVVKTESQGNEQILEEYVYDEFGNCVMKKAETGQTQFRYNVLDQLIWKRTDDDQETFYFYDPDGHLIRTQGGENTARTYDALGNLIQISDQDKEMQMEVNCLGQVLSQTDQDGRTERFWIDYEKGAVPVMGINAGEGWNCLVRDGKLLGGFEKGDWSTFLCDEKGSILRKLERNQTDWADPASWTKYDSFGGKRDRLMDSSDRSEERFGYTGLYYNPVGRTWRTASREYDSRSARFLSRDQDQFLKIQRPETLNQYQYCFGNPLVWVDPEGTDCYIFYLPEWENEAKNDQRQLAKEYGYDNSQVHLVPITDNQSFTDGWNAMGTENGRNVDIDTVVVNTHGNPSVLGNGDNSFLLSTTDINNLPSKDMDNMIILGCNSGHKDYSGSNVANAFAGKTNGAPVLASDGTVSSGLTFFNQTNRTYSSKNDKHFKGYRSGKRDNSGWVVYQEDRNGRVRTTDVGDKKMNVTDMNKELRKYPKTTATCSSGGSSGGGRHG